MKQGLIIWHCPLCGGRIVVSVSCQRSKNYKMRKDGTIGRRYTIHDDIYDSCTACCENPKCTARWEVNDFMVNARGEFIDRKYRPEVPE